MPNKLAVEKRTVCLAILKWRGALCAERSCSREEYFVPSDLEAEKRTLCRAILKKRSAYFDILEKSDEISINCLLTYCNSS